MSEYACQHCFADVIDPNLLEGEEEEIDSTLVAWCKSCINSDWTLLDTKGVELPPGATRGEFRTYAFFWVKDTPDGERIRSIPPKTARSFDAVLSAPDSVVTSIMKEVAQPPFCKRDYYGINCFCAGCWGNIEIDLSAPKLDFILCKKRYYGIECDCGNCPVPRKRR